MRYDAFLSAELPALGRYAAVLAGNKEVAEDILNDAMVIVVERIVVERWARIEAMDYPVAYIRRIVATSLLRYVRKNRPRFSLRSETAPEKSVPDKSYSQVDDRDQLTALLGRLSERQLTVVVGKYSLDMTGKELSINLGCRVSSVRSLMSRALVALRVAINEQITS